MDIDIYIPSDHLVMYKILEVLQTQLCLETEYNFVGANLFRSDPLIGQWLSFAAKGGPDIIDVYICPQGEFNCPTNFVICSNEP